MAVYTTCWTRSTPPPLVTWIMVEHAAIPKHRLNFSDRYFKEAVCLCVVAAQTLVIVAKTYMIQTKQNKQQQQQTNNQQMGSSDHNLSWPKLLFFECCL